MCDRNQLQILQDLRDQVTYHCCISPYMPFFASSLLVANNHLSVSCLHLANWVVSYDNKYTFHFHMLFGAINIP
jgi:hypothetical protein